MRTTEVRQGQRFGVPTADVRYAPLHSISIHAWHLNGQTIPISNRLPVGSSFRSIPYVTQPQEQFPDLRFNKHRTILYLGYPRKTVAQPQIPAREGHPKLRCRSPCIPFVPRRSLKWNCGSPRLPRMRREHALEESDVRVHGGIIPASAGSTSVHTLAHAGKRGSSPHTRGARTLARHKSCAS